MFKRWDQFHFNQNLDLGKASTNDKCHLAMPWATFVKSWGAYLGVFSPLTKSFLFFAGEQTKKCTLSWHTSACIEAVLFSSYKALKVGGVIQYDSDE